MPVFRSLFDIIGPVMVGPSSSHTAGAVRIGLVARSIFGQQPDNVEIVFYGSFAHTYRGHGTDLAIISGLLGLPTSSERIRQAYELADEKKMTIDIQTSDEPTEHPNTAKLIMSAGDRSLSLMGVSIGGGMIDIIEIDGFDVHLSGENPVILVFHQDRAGVINRVTNVLAVWNINISQMEVSRKSKGERALMVVATDNEIPDAALQQIGRLDQIVQVIAMSALKLEPDLIVSEEKEEYRYDAHA